MVENGGTTNIILTNPEVVKQACLDAGLRVVNERRKDGAFQFLTQCQNPQHGDDGRDENPSLQVTVRDGRVSVHCWVCGSARQNEVWKHFFNKVLSRLQTIKDYPVFGLDGTCYAIHRRIEYPHGGKTFKWLAPNGEPFSENGLRVNDLPLYGIHRLQSGEDVVIVEGEKAAEALRQVKIPAVGTYGASHRPSERRLKELLEVVGGGTIYLWPDNDEPGREHMDWIAGELRRLGAANVRMVVWPEAPKKGDAADAVARGVDIHRLLAAAQPADRQQADIEAELEGTDAHHARVLAQALRDRACWVPSWGWLVWTGTHWERDPEEAAVLRLAMDALSTYWLRRAQEAGNPEERKRLIDRLRAALNYTVVQRALKTARADLKARPEEFDADPWALAVENGVLDLRTRTLRPHSPANRNTKIAPVRFNPTASCPKFEQHLALVLPNPNVRRHVQRSLGLALVGACLEERLDIWHGDGANGKSTTARVLLEVLGDYADRAAPNLLVEKRHPEHPTALADLAGKRLVFSIEVEQGQKLAEALVKDLTGGDRKKARFLFKDYFRFDQTFSLFLLVNHRPEVRGTDTAIWRRIRLVPWTVIIPPEQRRPQEEVVAELAAEGAGILNWLLDGLHDWLQDRGWEAPEVQAATQNYKLEMDQVGRFVSDCCVLRPTARVETKALFEAYERWCQEAGETAFARKTVAQRLRAMGINEIRSHGRRYYVGVGLLDTNPTSPDGEGRVTDGDRFPQTFESSGDNKPKIGKIGHHLSPAATTTPVTRLTQHRPDGTITLSWDGKAEQVAPGELDGWRPIDEIPTINIPTRADTPPILVVDIEATGLDPTQDEILVVGLGLGRQLELLTAPTEAELLRKTFARLEALAGEHKNLILTGYNLLDFDLPFLIKRAAALGVACPFRLGETARKVAQTAGTVKGDPLTFQPIHTNLPVRLVDTMHLVARWDFVARELPGYDLKTVAEHFKVAVPGRPILSPNEIKQAYHEDPETFRRYVEADIIECLEIFRRLIPPFIKIADITQLPVDEITVRSTAWVWQQVLRRHYNRDPKADEKRTYPGGLVVARAGLWSSCFKLDVASLYPTIMLAYRIHGRKDPERVALQWLKGLTDLRLKYKAKAKAGDEEAKAISDGTKLLINSLYGFYGTGGYGFNDMEAAEKVTEKGRKILTRMIAAIEDVGGVVVEADTDGIIISHTNPEAVLTAIREAIPEPFKVELEWSGATVFVSDEKNYIVLRPDGTPITIKGAKWRGRDKEPLRTEFVPEFLRLYAAHGHDAADAYANEVRTEIESGKGWRWVAVTRRVGKGDADKFLKDAGYRAGDRVTFAYRDRQAKTISTVAEDGYDVKYYVREFDRLVDELRRTIGHVNALSPNLATTGGHKT